jgi:hypothetical protein
MILSPRKQRRLKREGAAIRQAWAKDEIKRGGATPALIEFLEMCLKEIEELRVRRKSA